MSIVKEWPCGIHDLSYRAVRAGCPACAAEKRAEELLIERDAIQREIDQMRGELARARGVTDLTMSMKSAARMLNDHDRKWLKDVLYRWRETKGVQLAVLPHARAFETEDGIHECTSVGGVGLCGLFTEAILAYGRPTAMNMLLRGMSEHLTGGTR